MTVPAVKQRNPYISVYEKGTKHKDSDPYFVVRNQFKKEWFAGFYIDPIDKLQEPTFSEDPTKARRYWDVNAAATDVGNLAIVHNIDLKVLCRPGKRKI